MNGFDAGLYTVTDTEPICYYYQTQTLNMEEVLEEQKKYTHAKIADFVISVGGIAEGVNDYNLVMEEEYVAPDIELTYYLYEKKADESAD